MRRAVVPPALSAAVRDLVIPLADELAAIAWTKFRADLEQVLAVALSAFTTEQEAPTDAKPGPADAPGLATHDATPPLTPKRRPRDARPQARRAEGPPRARPVEAREAAVPREVDPDRAEPPVPAVERG